MLLKALLVPSFIVAVTTRPSELKLSPKAKLVFAPERVMLFTVLGSIGRVGSSGKINGHAVRTMETVRTNRMINVFLFIFL